MLRIAEDNDHVADGIQPTPPTDFKSLLNSYRTPDILYSGCARRLVIGPKLWVKLTSFITSVTGVKLTKTNTP
ncbi:hypothetical protein R5R35_012688 [Gryllus longicercus]|uniref:Uncharacterized protein n=1 Tax=Gryllus longicercus TaxID=2509291 RepID=A0AAN9VWT7_9ORTH